MSRHLLRLAGPATARGFHTSRPALLKVGDSIPDIKVAEGSPGNKFSLAQELKGKKALLIGVPAAFSPACSSTHIPGYISARPALPIYVLAVNDAFVTNAWGSSLLANSSPYIPEGAPASDQAPSFDETRLVRFLADPAAEVTTKLGMVLDKKEIFGGVRSKRYAALVEDGTVKKVWEEPDGTGVNESRAEKVLKEID